MASARMQRNNFGASSERFCFEHAAHPIDRPCEVYRGRARRFERLRNDVEPRPRSRTRIAAKTQRDTHRGGDPDGGRAANHHGADRLGDAAVVFIGTNRFVRGEQALIDHANAVIAPFDSLDCHDYLSDRVLQRQPMSKS